MRECLDPLVQSRDVTGLELARNVEQHGFVIRFKRGAKPGHEGGITFSKPEKTAHQLCLLKRSEDPDAGNGRGEKSGKRLAKLGDHELKAADRIQYGKRIIRRFLQQPNGLHSKDLVIGFRRDNSHIQETCTDKPINGSGSSRKQIKPEQGAFFADGLLCNKAARRGKALTKLG